MKVGRGLSEPTPSMLMPPSSRVFVDESKSKGYYIAAAVAAPNDVKNLDSKLRALTLPGQNRIHFKAESDGRRRKLLSAFCAIGFTVAVYSVTGLKDSHARPLCLNALVDDLVAGAASQLILERDASVEKADRRTIQAALVRNDRYALSYEHAAPSQHAMLWVSDAVAWCYQAGGDWRRRVEPLIIANRNLA